MNLLQRLGVTGALIAALASPAAAQEAKNLKDIEEYSTRIKGGFFGRGGWLNNLDPNEASANPNSSYHQALDGILAFLQLYNEQSLPENYRELRRSCVRTLTENLYVENKMHAGAGDKTPGINDRIRERLKKEGILDFHKQLEYLLNESNAALNTARTTDEQERATWKSYNESLEQQANTTIETMLATRYHSRRGEVRNKDIETIITTHREAYEKIRKIKAAIAKGDYATTAKEFDGWRSKQSKGFEQLLLLQKDASAEAIHATARWATVAAFDAQGNPYVITVTPQFAQDWGDRGEKVYDIRDKIRANTAKIDGIKQKLQTEFSMIYANEVPSDRIIEGRLPTTREEAVLPEALADVLHCGDRLMVQRLYPGEPSDGAVYNIVGFWDGNAVGLAKRPGIKFPDNLADWKLVYEPANYAPGAEHASYMKEK